MDGIVKALKASHDFNETFTRLREKDKLNEADVPSVFNKRLFESRSSVVITKDARKIMEQNALNFIKGTPGEFLSKTEIRVMNTVVEGLKLIHKGQDHVKEALSRVTTIESYGSHEYITNSTEEEACSCYYIVHGGVEVTYDMNSGHSRSVYQPNIVYSHRSGEYIGIVSPEGAEDDLAPPATIYTREKTQILRIYRQKFHQEIIKLCERLREEKRQFLSGPSCKLKLPYDVIDKILDKLSRQEYPSNKVILEQDDLLDEMFLIVSGRCQLVHYVTIPDTGRRVKVMVSVNSTGEFFGEECILDRKRSYCEVMATSQTVCYKLHKSSLEVVQKDSLRNQIDELRNEYPEECDLLELGHRSCMWKYYKHKQVKSSLEEQGKLKYLYVPNTKRIRERPLSSKLQYRENLLRFTEKGAQYEPLKTRTQSANIKKSANRSKLPPRARTALGTMVTRTHEFDTSVDEEQRESSKVVSFPDKELTQEENHKELERLLSEKSDLGRQLRTAWQENEMDNSGFTRSGVLATMTTEDIVRKAKALADKQSENVPTDDNDDTGEEWDTIVHEENRHAKMYIAASKYRMAILRRKMKLLACSKKAEVDNKKRLEMAFEKRRLSYANFNITSAPSQEEEDSEPEDLDPEKFRKFKKWVATFNLKEATIEENENADDIRERFKNAVISSVKESSNQELMIRRMTIPWISSEQNNTDPEQESDKNQSSTTKSNHIRRFSTVSKRPHSTTGIFTASKPKERPKTAVTMDTSRKFKSISKLVTTTMGLRRTSHKP